MAVKPVEYVQNSSQAGFAVAGESKQITDDNAKIIKKDATLKYTKTLDNNQQTYLDKAVDSDDIEYTSAEQRKIGQNQINTDGSSNESSSGSTGWSTTGSVASAAGGGGAFIHGNAFGFDITTPGGTSPAPGAPDAMPSKATPDAGSTAPKPADNPGGGGGGETSGGGDAKAVQKSGQDTEKQASIPWMALVAGAIALAGGALALVSANKFDNQLGKRNEFKDQSKTINDTIQKFYDTLSADMNSMSENVQTYEDLSNSKVETFEISMNEITVLTCEMQEAELNGDTKKAQEKKQRIEELKQTQTDDSLESECQSLRDGMEEYNTHYNESLGVADSATQVANFLKQGEKMAKLAKVQLVFLAIGAALMLYGTIRAIIAAAKVPWPGNIPAFIVAAAGAAMMVGACAMVGISITRMSKKLKQENECNTKGIEMATKVTELQTNAQSQIDTNGTTVGLFDESDDTTTTTIDETKAEAENIAAENEKQLQKEMSNGATITTGIGRNTGFTSITGNARGTGSTSGTGSTGSTSGTGSTASTGSASSTGQSA